MAASRSPRGSRRRGQLLAAGLVAAGAGLIWVSLPDPPALPDTAGAGLSLAVSAVAPQTSGSSSSSSPPSRPSSQSAFSPSVRAPAPAPATTTPSAAGPSTTAPSDFTTAASPRPALPVHIEIPAIDVSATLVDLGLNTDRSLQTPTDFETAGWFTGGPLPGAPGPAVIAGHVDSTEGPAVFYRIAQLRPGDTITIRRGDDTTVQFTVVDVGQYAKDAFPAAEVYRWVDSPALRLITCGGEFDSDSGHYRDNVVVYAELDPPDVP